MRYSAAFLAFAASAVVAQPHRNHRCKHAGVVDKMAEIPGTMPGHYKPEPHVEEHPEGHHEEEHHDDHEVEHKDVDHPDHPEHPDGDHPDHPDGGDEDHPDHSDNNDHGGDFKHGELTYYDVGLGACGETDVDVGTGSSPEDPMVVAISYDIYFAGLANPNHNELCNKIIKLKTSDDGEIRYGKIRDACAACKMPGDADVNPKGFEQFYPMSEGRAPIQWELMD